MRDLVDGWEFEGKFEADFLDCFFELILLLCFYFFCFFFVEIFLIFYR